MSMSTLSWLRVGNLLVDGCVVNNGEDITVKTGEKQTLFSIESLMLDCNNICHSRLPALCAAASGRVCSTWARLSLFSHLTLLANVGSLRFPIDQFLRSSSDKLELRASFLSLSLCLLLISSCLVLLLLQTLLNEFLAGDIVSSGSFIGCFLDIGELLVELNKSLSDRSFGRLGNSLLDDTAGGVSERVVQEVVLAVTDLPLEVVNL